LEQAALLPTSGRALDLAGGSGRHGLWLAARGLYVTVSDVSAVGLGIAEREAEARGLQIQTLAVDLEDEPFPAGPWDVVFGHYYLHRPLFPPIIESLAAGGLLIYVQPTLSNLQRNSHPSARFLLKDGELPALVSDLETLVYDESWSPDGSHEARFVGRKNRSE